MYIFTLKCVEQGISSTSSCCSLSQAGDKYAWVKASLLNGKPLGPLKSLVMSESKLPQSPRTYTHQNNKSLLTDNSRTLKLCRSVNTK